MACVVLEKLSKVYLANKGGAVHELRRIDLALADGELLVLLGPSGSGKSTTLRLIAGLEEPTEGHIMIAGVVVNQTPAKDRDVAMVFQNHALYPHLSAYENMALSLKLRSYPPAEIAKRVMVAPPVGGTILLPSRRCPYDCNHVLATRSIRRPRRRIRPLFASAASAR